MKIRPRNFVGLKFTIVNFDPLNSNTVIFDVISYNKGYYYVKPSIGSDRLIALNANNIIDGITNKIFIKYEDPT